MAVQTAIKLTHGKASINDFFFFDHIVYHRVSFPRRRVSIRYFVVDCRVACGA